MRDNDIQLTEELIGLMLECKDYIERQIDCIEGESVLLSAEDGEREAGLRTRLNTYLADTGSEQSSTAIQPDSNQNTRDAQPALRQWQISLRFGEDVLRNVS